MAKREFKGGTMLNPVPVVIVSCGGAEEKPNIITVAWTGIVNSEPPMTYVSVRKSRYSHDIIARDKTFVINLVNEKLVEKTDFCGVKSGRDIDKFEVTGLTAIPGSETGCPMIEESPVNMECRVVDVHEYPSHDMFVAEIVKVHVDEDIIDRNDRMRLDRADLVCYNHGEYFGVKEESLGKFGFSVMKDKTKKKLMKEASKESRDRSRMKSKRKHG